MSIFKISYFCLAYLRHDVITARLDRWRAPVRNYVMCFNKEVLLFNFPLIFFIIPLSRYLQNKMHFRMSLNSA